MAKSPPVVLCLTANAEPLAQRIAAAIGGAVHGRYGRTTVDTGFAETTSHIRDLFAAGIPVVGICAAGILIRSVAPLLSDKRAEPPVIAVSEDGTSVVPLLGGHQGANALARRIAQALEIQPSITTASDLSLGVALDEPPAGWALDPSSALTQVTAALIAGEQCTVTGDAPFLAPLDRLGHVTRAPSPPAPHAIESASIALAAADSTAQISYTARTITLGVGCARHCPSAELADLALAALAEATIPTSAIAGVFSLDLKADEAAVLDLARTLGVPARFFSAHDLEREAPRLANPSDVVFAEVGCHGVSEGAALAAAGSTGRLIVEKRKSANATVAAACAGAPITAPAGRRRGRVSLIGIGPGQATWRAPEASRLIVEADELVGYGFYIDLLGPLAAGKPRADFPLGGEEDRCRYALEQAGTGRDVAIICSGDAGIYAMGALVYELMGRAENGVSDAARRVDVLSVPGISALQGAAARIGAPLGHDFCAISLSDLLTPREDILRRIKAAAEGDFVIAFYNPVSKRRKELFVNAIDILSQHRPADTPVVIATSLGREGESVTLRTVDTVSVDEVDMMTLVMVGSSQSRTVQLGGQTRVYTPRGYARKLSPTPGP